METENVEMVAIKPAIGKEEVRKASSILKEYKAQKKNLETKIIENYEWYRLRQWECMRRKVRKEKGKDDEVEPSSAWLFDAIINKHADMMDNIPAANILPREELDVEEAERLSSIIPVILKQCKFEEKYDSAAYDKIIAGLGILGVFWDNTKLNGLGDISIRQIDPLSIYWEPGISNIQDSENVFTVELRNRKDIIDEFPALKLSEEELQASEDLKASEYRHDDAVDVKNKCVVVSWYYKKRQNGKTVLHYVKYVGDIVLYASENDIEYDTEDRIAGVTGDTVTVKTSESTAETGYYIDGQYPFSFDRCFPIKGSPGGFGYVDVEKSPQEFIDRVDSGILTNVLFNANPRHFSSSNGGINEKEFCDAKKLIVHVEGSLDENHVKPITQNPLPGNYLQVLDMKINELKETSGNRDVANGGTTGGVTAASGIAAMQEASGKKSRDMNQASYRRFEELIYMVIERIRQFYNLPRQFRITGKDGEEKYISYSNEKIRLQSELNPIDNETVFRLPEFDIEVSAQKKSAYSKLSQNELALQFYGAGFFIPENATAAAACLEMMDFDGKSIILKKIKENGTLYQQVQQLRQLALSMASELDSTRGTNLASELYNEFTGQPLQGAVMRINPGNNSPGQNEESSITVNARAEAAQRATPNS